ncbi:MAG: PAS domain-containing protein [Desulfobacterales bacterium]|nr:PAS domain-containing protein [Desulfobacterales bacterium]
MDEATLIEKLMKTQEVKEEKRKNAVGKNRRPINPSRFEATRCNGFKTLHPSPRYNFLARRARFLYNRFEKSAGSAATNRKNNPGARGPVNRIEENGIDPMESEISYEQIFNATSNGVVVTNRDGRIVHMNRQAEIILDARAEDNVENFISDFLPITGPLVMECLETGRPRLGSHIIGKQVDLVLNISLIEEKGEILGAVCNFQEREQFETSARKLESHRQMTRQLKTIFEASSDGIWVCDGEGKVINVNSASARLNGIEREKIIGRNISALMAKGFFDRSVTLEVLESRRQVSMMQYVRKTDRWLLATGTPAFDEDGRVSLVIVNERDMTQLNAVRDELERTHMITEKMKTELTELSLLELKDQEIIAESKAMEQVLRIALKLASVEASNILILGESGTGKGLLTKFIHKNGPRCDKPFIQINCAALPGNLLEAELFGHEKGAFTGARERGKAGLFELAHEGTLFLDEIGDLPLQLQAKLLKYLDDHEIMRLGGVESRKIDCCIIAATNRNLEKLTKTKRFRRDLYYRLNTFSIHIPPLSQRPEDIFELVSHFLKKYNKMYGLNKRIFPEALEMLQSYPFPGNVRELKNILKKAVVMSEEAVLDGFIARSLRAGGKIRTRAERDQRPRPNLTDALAAFEKDFLKTAMTEFKTTRELAADLGISQPTVVRKLRKHGLSPN